MYLLHIYYTSTDQNNLIFRPSMVASAGETDWDLAATQFTKNLHCIQYYRVLNIVNLKLHNVL
jgi:hypothetical protein